MPNAAFNFSNITTSLVQNTFLVTGNVVIANTANITYNPIVGVPFTLQGAVPSQKLPNFVTINSSNAAGVSSFEYVYHPPLNGNVQVGGGVQIFANGNLASELPTGNLPAAVTSDVITFMAIVPR